MGERWGREEGTRINLKGKSFYYYFLSTRDKETNEMGFYGGNEMEGRKAGNEMKERMAVGKRMAERREEERWYGGTGGQE